MVAGLNEAGRIDAEVIAQEQGVATTQRWLQVVDAELREHVLAGAARAVDRRKPRAVTSGIVAEGSGFVLYLGGRRICSGKYDYCVRRRRAELGE